MNQLSYLNGSSHMSTKSSGFASNATWGQIDYVTRLGIRAWPGVLARGMFGMLKMAKPAESSLENPEKESLIRSRVTSREVPRQSPERAQPNGRYPDATQALKQFADTRAETIRYASETDADLFRVSAEHPAFGTVNGYELLLIIAGHAQRHTGQIEETQRSLA